MAAEARFPEVTTAQCHAGEEEGHQPCNQRRMMVAEALIECWRVVEEVASGTWSRMRFLPCQAVAFSVGGTICNKWYPQYIFVLISKLLMVQRE